MGSFSEASPHLRIQCCGCTVQHCSSTLQYLVQPGHVHGLPGPDLHLPQGLEGHTQEGFQHCHVQFPLHTHGHTKERRRLIAAKRVLLPFKGSGLGRKTYRTVRWTGTAGRFRAQQFLEVGCT